MYENLPNNGVNISEVKVSEACLVSENLTLPIISHYTVLSIYSAVF